MQKEEKEGGGKGEAGGWLQKNGVELSISPEETSSHFTIVPFPSRVRQGLKSACYSGPSHPPILPSNIKRMFRYLGVDRSSALFKFFIQNFGKLGGRETARYSSYPSRDEKLDPRKLIGIVVTVITVIVSSSRR